MRAKKYRIIKSKALNTDPTSHWYHVELWRWYWPFWTIISARYDTKNMAKCLISDHRNNIAYVEQC